MEARPAHARLLALQRCVQNAGAWAGCGVEDLVSHRDADSDGPATWRGLQSGISRLPYGTYSACGKTVALLGAVRARHIDSVNVLLE